MTVEQDEVKKDDKKRMRRRKKTRKMKRMKRKKEGNIEERIKGQGRIVRR